MMPTVKIGWGRRETSINEPVSIPGQAHLRISEGIHDPLYVTALCVDGGQGQDAVIFCSADITSLRNDVVRLTRDAVAAMRPEIPVDAIIMNATHTHTCASLYKTPEQSPDGQPIYPGETYRDFFVQQCAEAICQAWDTRAEGGIAYGYGYAVVAHSRRTVYLEDLNKDNPLAMAPNGYGCMYGNTKRDTFSHYEAGADHFLNAMFTFDAHEKLTGVVVNVPCPSQVSEMMTKLSADYWNEVREEVAREFGPDVYVLPQCAAAGDLSPRLLHYKEAQARRMKLKYGMEYDPAGSNHQYNKCIAERRDIGQRILEGLKDIYSWAKKDIQTQVPVRCVYRELQLARRMITPEEKQWCEDNIEKIRELVPSREDSSPEEYRKAMSRYNSIKNRNTRVIERFAIQQQTPTLPMGCYAVQIGDIAFATNRFELFMDFQHRIQARSPFVQTFVVQIAGAEGGTYLPTVRGAANKGYSASIFCNVVGPEGGQQLVEGTLEMLNELKNQDI